VYVGYTIFQLFPELPYYLYDNYDYDDYSIIRSTPSIFLPRPIYSISPD